MPHRPLLALVAPLALLALGACEDVSVNPARVSRIEVLPDEVELQVGQEATLEATLYDAAGNELSGREVEWTSSAPDLVSVDAGGRIRGLEPGEDVVVTASADDATGEAVVRVEALPAIALRPRQVVFEVDRGDPLPDPADVSVTNAGGGVLSGLDLSVSYGSGRTGWLGATLNGSTAPSTLRLRPGTTELDPGEYTASVQVSSPEASNGEQTVTVVYRVEEPPPRIFLGTESLAFSATEGAVLPATQIVSVDNGGGGGLTGLAVAVRYQAGGPTGWLEAVLADDEAPTALVVSASARNLSEGSYTGFVDVSSEVAGNSPRTIEVSFEVTARAPPPSPPGSAPTSAAEGAGP